MSDVVVLSRQTGRPRHRRRESGAVGHGLSRQTAGPRQPSDASAFALSKVVCRGPSVTRQLTAHSPEPIAPVTWPQVPLSTETDVVVSADCRRRRYLSEGQRSTYDGSWEKGADANSKARGRRRRNDGRRDRRARRVGRHSGRAARRSRAERGDRNAIARGGLDRARKVEARRVHGRRSRASAIEIGNTDDDLAKLADCDLVIEAIIEQLEPKRALYERLERCCPSTRSSRRTRRAFR